MRLTVPKMAASLVIGFCVLGTGCTDDNPATQDLPVDKIMNHVNSVDVIVNADQFPNFAHTCWTADGAIVGFWSTTDRVTIIVYNDWLCPGSSREQPMQVLSGNPRDVINNG
jgi:hypothetical protein